MAETGSDITKATLILQKGDLVAIPTETVYGLAGNAFDDEAVTKIFEVKNRPTFDPLIVHTHHYSQLDQFVHQVPEPLKILAEKFWPGPLTLLLPKKPIIPDLVTSGMERVAVRIPNHELTLTLLRNLKFPLVAPSANPFGYVSPTTPVHVNDQLGDRIPYILDGGPCQIGLESTIVGLENDQPTVYRLGGLELESIENEIGKVNVMAHSSSNPKSPGMLKSHYSPQKEVFTGNIWETYKELKHRKIGFLLLQETEFDLGNNPVIYLSKNKNIREAAKNLFAGLRKMDTMDIDIILAEEAPDQGLGKAINDRLKRASVA